MQKKLRRLGVNISSKAEIQNISNQGVWVLVNEQEFFMPFLKFPWFLKATIKQIYNLQLFHSTHLYWPELDIDLHIDSIKNPHAYPLTYAPTTAEQ